MKKKLIILTSVMVFCVSILFLFPSQAFAELPPGDPGSSFAHINVDVANSETESTFTISLLNMAPTVIIGCLFVIFKYDGSLEQLGNEPDSGQFMVYEESSFFDSSNINWEKVIKKKLLKATILLQYLWVLIQNTTLYLHGITRNLMFIIL